MLVRLNKYLLLGPGIRTVGGETAVRRYRSSLEHASPENPPGLGPCGVSEIPPTGGVEQYGTDGFVRRGVWAGESYAVLVAAASCRPSSWIACSRMTNFCIFPVTVMGNTSTNFQ